MTPEELAVWADQADQSVAMLTGIKAKLITQGWSESMAEQMVVAMVYSGAKQ